MLKDHANDPIDIDRVIKMLLIHDLGEIDAGDTIVYASDSAGVKEKEESGIKRLFAMLPEEQAAQYKRLRDEFEEGMTADAVYARAIDRPQLSFPLQIRRRDPCIAPPARRDRKR